MVSLNKQNAKNSIKLKQIAHHHQHRHMLAMHRQTCKRALRQHGAQQRVMQQNAHKQAAAADDEKSGCGAER
jgi:hypothetical protein